MQKSPHHKSQKSTISKSPATIRNAHKRKIAAKRCVGSKMAMSGGGATKGGFSTLSPFDLPSNHNPTQTPLAPNQSTTHVLSATLSARRTLTTRTRPTTNPTQFQPKTTLHSQTFRITTTTRHGAQLDTNQQCWNCPDTQPPLSGLDLFCGTCKAIQGPEIPLSKQNYFQLYSLPMNYNTNQPLLEKRFRTLQQSLHPDLFTTKSSTEQEIAEGYATFLNRSFDILSDDVLRAKYIIFLLDPIHIMNDESLPDYEHLPTLVGHPLTVDPETGEAALRTTTNLPTKSKLTMMQLSDILEKREIVEDSTDMNELVALFRDNNVVINDLKQEIAQVLDDPNFQHSSHVTDGGSKVDITPALLALESLHYYRNMQRDLVQRIPTELLGGNDQKKF